MTDTAAYIVDGQRTPFLKAKGVPGQFSASDLAVNAARQMMLRQSFEPAEFSEVIVGCVMPAADEANIARLISLRLGCGKKVPAWTVQRNCASGLQALDSAAQLIRAGRSSLILAGGTESMSRAPVIADESLAKWLGGLARARGLAKLGAIAAIRPKMLKPVISLLVGLTDHTVGLSMGQTAEIVANRFGIDRQQMDAFALESHKKAESARAEGRLAEIAPVYDTGGKALDRDDGVRTDTTMEQLAKLKPVFDRPYGNVTAGNSAQVTDGSAMLILAARDALEKYNLKPIARLTDVRWAGLDPAQMGLGPTHSIDSLLTANSLDIGDIDYWEINEAFAGQVLASVAALADDFYARSELGRPGGREPIPMDKLNIDGGAIAIGHPVGASGARLVLHMANTLARTGARRGVVSMCIGGGQGGAALIESVPESVD